MVLDEGRDVAEGECRRGRPGSQADKSTILNRKSKGNLKLKRVNNRIGWMASVKNNRIERSHARDKTAT